MVSPERLTRLFNSYHDTIVRFAARRTGDRDLAEEIAQETFVRAFRQDAIESERSWLFAVAANLLRDAARSAARRERAGERLHAAAADAAPQESALDALAREDDRRMARLALEGLAERDRDALLMREEGLGYEEIAAALEIAVGSVGTTLSRARRRLMEGYERLRLEQEEGAP